MYQERKPVLSVIISVYNQSNILEKCLKHLHEQSLSGIEYIIIDNGSDVEQKTLLVDALKDYVETIYFPLSMHMSVYESYNVGLMLSKGKYVVFWNVYDEADISYLKGMIAYGKDDSVCVIATDVHSQPKNYDARKENVVLKKNLTDKPVALINPKLRLDMFLQGKLDYSIHGKAFSRVFLMRHGLFFFEAPDVIQCFIFSLKCLIYAKQYVVLPLRGYTKKHIEETSMVNFMQCESLKNVLTGISILTKYIHNNKLLIHYHMLKEPLLRRYVYSLCAAGVYSYSEYKHIKEMLSGLRDNYDNEGTLLECIREKFVSEIMYDKYDKDIFPNEKKDIVYNVNQTNYGRRCLLVYITYPFCMSTGMEFHQMLWQSKALVSVLGDFGYDVDVMDYEAVERSSIYQYDLLISHTGWGVDLPLLKPHCLKIWYSVSMEPAFAYESEQRRLMNLFHRRHQSLQGRLSEMSIDESEKMIKKFDGIFAIANPNTKTEKLF